MGIAVRGEAERKTKELTGRDTPKGVKRKASKGNEPGGGTKKANYEGSVVGHAACRRY